ncbi:MAG TPA: hypothetical protein VK589_30125 [Chryseolinea sp.]|nr:hypothetical protein [Chryseolinea sp.]
MKKHILLPFFILISSISFAQETATITLSRKGLWSGTAGATKIFMDGNIICELSNNSFSIHSIPTGKHVFTARWYSKKAKEKDNGDEFAVEIEIKPSEQYYLQVVKQDKGLSSYVAVQEITSNTWNKIKEGLDKGDCH